MVPVVICVWAITDNAHITITSKQPAIVCARLIKEVILKGFILFSWSAGVCFEVKFRIAFGHQRWANDLEHTVYLLT